MWWKKNLRILSLRKKLCNFSEPLNFKFRYHHIRLRALCSRELLWFVSNLTVSIVDASIQIPCPPGLGGNFFGAMYSRLKVTVCDQGQLYPSVTYSLPYVMRNNKHKVHPTAQKKYFPPAASGSKLLLLENICVGFSTCFHFQNANIMYEE